MNGSTIRWKRCFFGGSALACLMSALVLAPGVAAAGSTQVTHFSFTTPRHQLCGIWGTAEVSGTSVFRDTGNGTFFMSGTWFGVFTAAGSGKSATLQFAGPQKQTSPAVIDEQAGTVTITTTYGGLFEKLSITHGPTLTRDAGIVTWVQVFQYTGDPNDPLGELISESFPRLHGPHPDLLSGFSVFCDVLGPYLQGP